MTLESRMIFTTNLTMHQPLWWSNNLVHCLHHHFSYGLYIHKSSPLYVYYTQTQAVIDSMIGLSLTIYFTTIIQIYAIMNIVFQFFWCFAIKICMQILVISPSKNIDTNRFETSFSLFGHLPLYCLSLWGNILSFSSCLKSYINVLLLYFMPIFMKAHTKSFLKAYGSTL